MRSKLRCGRPRGRLLLEAVAVGLAYGGGLCWASVCLLASFRPNNLGAPYWSVIPHLRTDTCGIAAFILVAVSLSLSEYLRLYRQRGEAHSPRMATMGGRTGLLSQAAAKTAGVLATGLVVYLSVNAVTHPATLNMPATHLLSWPTEGTLRVASLVLCACSISVLRYASPRIRELSPRSRN
jgi:hypothetical protein